MGDLNSVLERIVALRQAIVADGCRHGVPFHVNDLQTLIERSGSEGSSFVLVTLPKLGKALDVALTAGYFKLPNGFTTRKGTKLPRFLYSAFSTIIDDEGCLRPKPNVVSIFFLRQFLLLDSKFISEPNLLQKKLAIDGFRDRQIALRKVRIPRSHPVLLRAQQLLTWTLRGLSLETISPGHGPGSVAEGLDRNERWDFDSWPSRAERWYPYHEYGVQSFMALCSRGAPRMLKNSVTRCALVPKDYKGPRLISAESAATQYLQQGQMKSLMRYIDNHWLLSRSIRLRDQTHNQRMCYAASGNGSVTLDLSNASDTVSATLVWYLLAGVPALRSQLFCTRSQSMEIDGELVRLVAFSPMGSAVCFPVETLVFWSLSLASLDFVISSWGPRRETKAPRISELASQVAVFGDDIVVPDTAIDTLIGVLQTVGCEPNASKTCIRTPFRESCGSEWYNQTDVTIIRNRRYDYVATTISNYPIILDLQRKFFVYGLQGGAALLRRWAQEIAPVVTLDVRFFKGAAYIGNPKAVVRDTARGFLCIRPDDESLPFSPVLRRISSEQHGEQDHMGNLLHDGNSFTAFPSGLGKLMRDTVSFDKLTCAIWYDTSLDRGVRTRYNKGYQRFECRVPRLFQLSRNWDSYEVHPDTSERPPKGTPRVGTRDCFPHGKRSMRTLTSGYPRLLARVVGDSIERIAIRYTDVYKMAWSELPFYWSFNQIVG